MNSEPRWSFLKDDRTTWPVNGERWMLQRIENERQLRQRFMRDGVFDNEKIEQYFVDISRFKEQLAICTLVTAGIPLRPSELFTLQHENLSSNIRRNIFIEDGMVALVTGFNDITETKLIVRFLPREVGELVIWYLWLVLPFVRHLSLWQSNQAPSGRLDSRRRCVLPFNKDACLWGPDPGIGQEWTYSRLNRVLERETEARLEYALDIASYNDIAVGISRRLLERSNAFPNYFRADQRRKLDLMDENAEDYDDIDFEEWMDILYDWDRETETAGMAYACEISERPNSASDLRAKFRACSTDWHRRLGLESCGRAPSLLGKRVGAPSRGDGD
ncbi:hypothetical protein VTN31DRAFT_5271 [Thermomyces dupontii]|uniref:uncharacterized protein n=2 Tax=Talaromyces thermophilus TaxID=28565 RepID=UPI003742DC03